MASFNQPPRFFYFLHATAASPPFRLSDFSLSAYPPCHAVGAQREGGSRLALDPRPSPARHAVVAQREGGPLTPTFRPPDQPIQPFVEIMIVC